MEYIQAVIIAFNRILSPIKGPELFDLFAVCVLLVYLIRNRKNMVQIIKYSIIALLYCTFVYFVGVKSELSSTLYLLLHLIFDIAVMVYVSKNSWKMNRLRFAWWLAAANFFLTIIAVITPINVFWKKGKINPGLFGNRLQLLYVEPAYLTFISGLLLVFFVYQLLAKGTSRKAILGIGFCLIEMLLSRGIGGILTSLVSVFILIIMWALKRRSEPHRYKGIRDTVPGFITIVIATAIICSLLFIPSLNSRIFSITQGKDLSLEYNVISPIRAAVNSLSETNGRGYGIGSVAKGAASASLSVGKEINNSFMKVVTEGGVAGIILVLIVAIGLLMACIRYGGMLDAALYFYIMVFQFTGGKFEDPVNFFIYGWIIGDCLIEIEKQKKKETRIIANKDIPVTVAIIGAKGLANYGGYETFVDKLTEYHQGNDNINYLIACKANGKGAMDETKLKGVVPLSNSEFMYHNAHCFKLKVPQIGGAQAIVYDLLAARYAINYFKRYSVEKPVLYILTCRIGPFISFIAKRMHEIGGVYWVNPDGNEWRRNLYSPTVRKYWKFSEKLMIKYADKVICDSKNIETYITASYDQYEPNTKYIAYGADLEKSKISDDDKIIDEWYDTWKVRSKGYYLIVGRFVPENNYEAMIREYMMSDSKRTLIIVTNVNQTYLDELEEKLHFSRDKRIRFVGTIYDQQLLKKIRENAYGYLHGHEVGGTNPSLLEALGSTDLNLLLNVGFNRECGEDGALYWDKEGGSLSALINKCDEMDNDQIEHYGVKAKKRIEAAYSWEFIASEYEKVFMM